MKKNNTGRIAAGILSVLILITSFPNVSAAEELPETEMIMQDAEEAEENVSDEEQDRIDEVKDSGIDEVLGNDNPGKTEVSTWTDLQEALGDVRVSEIKLSGDITADDSDDRLQAAGNAREERAVTIDLNGFELNRNLSKHKHNGHVIEVSEKAALTIKDTGTDKTGKITGGWSSEDGGGIRVENGGALTVEDAYITGNRSDGNGGGIHVENGGTLIIEGGSISNNRAGGDGGGICSYGTVNMTEGSVTGNTASSGGGGIFVGAGNDAAFRADNVLIVDNHALDENGGGIKNTGKAVLDNCDVGGNTS